MRERQQEQYSVYVDEAVEIQGSGFLSKILFKISLKLFTVQSGNILWNLKMIFNYFEKEKRVQSEY